MLLDATMTRSCTSPSLILFVALTVPAHVVVTLWPVAFSNDATNSV